MTVIINHPNTFKSGTRVLMLTGRNKDGVTCQRKVLRVSLNAEQFDVALGELVKISEPNERIYASAGRRSIQKASRLFRKRQLDSEYDQNPMEFYEKLSTRWASCLMDPSAQEERLWLFDIDNDEDSELVVRELKSRSCDFESYVYDTKNGKHVLVEPFNRLLISETMCSMIKENPMMLWGY